MFCCAYPKRHSVVGGEPKTPRRPPCKVAHSSGTHRIIDAAEKLDKSMRKEDR